MRLVYCEKAYLPIGEHVFRPEKYSAMRECLIKAGAFNEGDFLAPLPCRDDDLLLVHTPLWVEKIRRGTMSIREELELEVPYSRELADAFCYMAGGSILASELALREGCCVHLGGGFHHAFADHGEGFCLINDIAIAIRCMQREGRIARAMVVDCDVHQGNGTAAIFGSARPEVFPAQQAALLTPQGAARIESSPARDVFTISLHQANNYPYWKPPSSIDVNLPDGTTDAEYLHWLERALKEALARFEPELICYVAGADPFVEDQLGGLGLSIEGLKQRDLRVFRFAREHGFPVMATLAGGYARSSSDTVAIHVNTALAAKEVFGDCDKA
jgi:acetoin utilization deacetylase AcuC-like enzyme